MADEDIALRVAILEQIAKNTETALRDIRTDIRGLRDDIRADIRGLRDDFRADTGDIRTDIRDLRRDMRWLMGAFGGGFLILLGVMAHGFHWL